MSTSATPSEPAVRRSDLRELARSGSITFEFHANKPGTFTFYCNLTSVDACAEMKGTLVVSPK